MNLSGCRCDAIPAGCVRVVVDLLKGEHKGPEYQRLNPNGKVPLLDDDGFMLWESHAIMQYLADGSPGQDIYPADVEARADVNRWLFWSAYHFTPAVGFISRERVSKKTVGGSGAPNPVEIARGEALLAAAAQLLDDHLARNRRIAQDKLTLADLAIASPLMHTVAAELPVTGYEAGVVCTGASARGLEEVSGYAVGGLDRTETTDEKRRVRLKINGGGHEEGLEGHLSVR